MPHPSGNTPRRSRPSYLAAPPLLTEREPFEGADVLREHPGALGALLWKSLRDLAAWTALAPAERAALFPAGAGTVRAGEIADAGAEPELWGPLLVVARLLENPTEVDHPRLVNACRAVARWGERRGFAAVQLAYTQAAACLAPEHAKLAYAVGRLARDRGEYARGETWLRKAVRLARGTDWHTYALAYLSLGTLYQQLGNLPAARTLTQRGYRAAVRRRVRPLHGVALHNLFIINAEMLEFARAQEYALAAVRRYGQDHPRFAVLVHDVGCFWMLHGQFTRACDVFATVLDRIQRPEERLMATSTLARAAAADGRADAYAAGVAGALAILESEATPPERSAQGWLNLARAAATAGDRPRARTFGTHALQIATRLRLGQICLEVEAILQAVEGSRIAERVQVEPAFPSQWNARADEMAQEILDLVRSAA
jgi:tetratricopeptide (TPR) repeat protein